MLAMAPLRRTSPWRTPRSPAASAPDVPLAGLGREADLAWLAGTGVGLLLAVLAGTLLARHGVALAYLSVLLRASWYARESGRVPLFDRLLRLGLVAGVFLVLGDYLRASVLPDGRLVYLTRDAVLLGTPPYVPLGWACAVVEIGYLPLRLYAHLRGPRSSLAAAAVASVLAAALAGVGLGTIEVLAARAGWWKYETTAAMLAPSVAAYAPLGEGLAFLALVPLALRALRGGVLLWGMALAGVVVASQVLAWVALTVVAR
jgi:hypothetical protein